MHQPAMLDQLFTTIADYNHLIWDLLQTLYGQIV